MVFKIFILLFLVLVLYSGELFIVRDISHRNISRYFYGVNVLNFVNYDNLPYYLRDLDVGRVIYPGGEIADNYNWKFNKVYDKNFLYFKFRKNNLIDFDLFMNIISHIHIEPIIVVNLEEGFMEHNLTKYAKLAAQWVYYANKIKKYHIKYWIIGNESYNLPTRYALSVKDYIRALKIYSKFMKEIDPTIKIGAIGPFNFKAIPVIDTLCGDDISKVRILIKNHKRFIVRKMYNLYLYGDMKRAWWFNLFKEAKNSIDFIVLHYYFNKNDLYIKDNWFIYKDLSQFNFLIKKLFNKNVPIFITEFGFTNKISKILENKKLNVIFVKMMINFIKTKNLKFISYWPLKYYNWKVALLDNEGKKSFLYNLYKFFIKNLKGKLLDIKGLHDQNDDIFLLGVIKNRTLKFVVLNNSSKNKSVIIKFDHKMFAYIHKCEVFNFNNKNFLILKKVDKITNYKFNIYIKSYEYVFLKCM